MTTLIKRGLSFTLSVLSTGTLAQVAQQDKVVYGVDNRVEVYEAPESLKTVAASTAAMIPIGKLTLKVDEVDQSKRFYEASQELLKDNGICEDDRYANQPTPGMCSGFLVGPDLIVTAGHCARGWRTCEDNTWVFGFAVDAKTGEAGKAIPAENVYRCKTIVNQKLNQFLGTDHALIQLDRIVTDRAPLKFRSEGKIDDTQGIVVIGHPMGLPTKIADGANVRTNTHSSYFVANLDTFGGNSGSAVFNADDLTVEGILVRGEDDYKYNSDKMCQEVFTCEDDKCRGEDVTRITDIIELAQGEKVLAAASVGDKAVVEAYLALKGWANMYDNARESILMKAAAGQQMEIAAMVMNAGADVSLQDLSGKTALHHLAAGAVSVEGSAEFLKTMLGKGLQINAQDTLGETALMKAVKARNAAMVEMLLNSGADAKLINKAGLSALKMTKWYNLKHSKIRKLLKAALKKEA